MDPQWVMFPHPMIGKDPALGMSRMTGLLCLVLGTTAPTLCNNGPIFVYYVPRVLSPSGGSRMGENTYGSNLFHFVQTLSL